MELLQPVGVAAERGLDLLVMGEGAAVVHEGARYKRVADDIAGRIASGEVKSGTRLRSERDLAEYYGVAYGTIRRAMKLLRERGLIRTVHGHGTFIA